MTQLSNYNLQFSASEQTSRTSQSRSVPREHRFCTCDSGTRPARDVTSRKTLLRQHRRMAAGRSRKWFSTSSMYRIVSKLHCLMHTYNHHISQKVTGFVQTVTVFQDFPGLAKTKFQGFPGLTKLVFKDLQG